MDQKKRVLLGMRGGTDSSVAAILLQEAGYEVTGVTFRFYELNDSVEYLEDARMLAERLAPSSPASPRRGTERHHRVQVWPRPLDLGRSSEIGRFRLKLSGSNPSPLI